MEVCIKEQNACLCTYVNQQLFTLCIIFYKHIYNQNIVAVNIMYIKVVCTLVKKVENDGESLLHVIKTTVLEVRNMNERREQHISPYTCASFLPYFEYRDFDVVVLPIVSSRTITIILILDYMCVPCIVFFPPFLASLP